MQNLLSEIQNYKKIIIIGDKNSGKSQFLKELIKELSFENSILLFSNHHDIRNYAMNPLNVKHLYKPKSCKVVDSKYLLGKYDYKVIDEKCENLIELISESNFESLISVASKDEKNIEDLLKVFDLIIEVKKANSKVSYSLTKNN